MQTENEKALIEFIKEENPKQLVNYLNQVLEHSLYFSKPENFTPELQTSCWMLNELNKRISVL